MRLIAISIVVTFSAVVLSGCGGHKAQSSPADTITTGLYQPVKPPALLRAGTVNNSGVATSGSKRLEVVTEPFSSSKTDASVSLASQGRSRYLLTVTNTSPYAHLTSFVWQPTVRVTISALTTSSNGTCLMVPGSLPKQQAISCSSLDLKPPSCACQADGTVSTLGGNGGTIELHLVMHLAAASKYIGVGTPYKRLRGLGTLGILNITGETVVLHTTPLKSGSRVRVVNLTGG